jgi:hypothetical protein
MRLNDIAKPVTAAQLNENLARKFGERVKIESFTLEQLENVRNKIRTKLSQIETNESFDSVRNEEYQKNKMFLDVLNAAIAESKPDFLDMDKDGDKKEPMKKAIKDKKKKSMKKESVIREGEEDKAQLIMASKDMVDRLTGWMEDTAEMQTESMLELADAIRDELGSEQSEAFTGSVRPALESLYTAMEQTRTALTQGVGLLTGEGDELGMMGADDDLGGDMDMEPTTDMDIGDDELDMDADPEVDLDGEDDEFGAAGAADGGEEPMGREKRESVERKRAMIESSRRIGAILSTSKKK